MTISFKKAIGSSMLAALVVGGVALTAVAPASAATVDTGITVKAAVQGDRIQGPFVTRSGPGANIYIWNNWFTGDWQGTDVPTKTTYSGSIPPGPPPAFQEPTEIWSFPAVGTTGPIMNPEGKCLRYFNDNAVDRNLVVLGSCDGAPNATVGATGVLMLGGIHITDRNTVDPYMIGITGVTELIAAETLYMAGMTPVVVAVDCTAGLTGSVSNIDQSAKSAVVSGTGAAGETITVTGSPTGAVTATVGTDGNWTATIPGLVEGDNALSVTSSDNCAPVELSVIIEPLEIPVMHPAAAASAGVLGLGMLAFGVIRRRKTARI